MDRQFFQQFVTFFFLKVYLLQKGLHMTIKNNGLYDINYTPACINE